MIRRTLSLIQFSPLILRSVKMTIHLTLEQEKKLKEYLKEKTLSWQMKKRLESIRLLSKGVSPNLVGKQMAIRSQLVYEYIRTFRSHGVEGLIKMEKPGKETKLTEGMLEDLEHFIQMRQNKGKNMTREQKAGWLLTTYQVEISPQWLSQRLATRARAKKEEPWR